jgi:uncharacterized MnhB-related membrane protein
MLVVAAAATGVVFARDVARQAVVFGLFGFSLVLLFVVLQAPDVALSEFAVGVRDRALDILIDHIVGVIDTEIGE